MRGLATAVAYHFTFLCGDKITTNSMYRIEGNSIRKREWEEENKRSKNKEAGCRGGGGGIEWGASSRCLVLPPPPLRAGRGR